MKAKVRSFSRITLVLMLSIVCCFSMFLAIGCGKTNKPGAQTTTKSIFEEKQTTYVLSKDYQLTKTDETARKGAENEVKFDFATSFDLGGHTLDLNGRTLTIVSQEQGCVVTFTNGTVKGGTLNISVPNGDVEFTTVELTETVKYDLEAASNTIRMSNSKLKGSCTIKSNTHVEISQSSVENVTLDGNGTINVNQGSSLGNLEVSERATGATVNVREEATVTGGLTLGAAANVKIAGSVAKVDVKETVVSTDENKLNITVGEGAKVNQIDLKSAAEVSLAGEVDHVSVANENANVTVASSANVDKVEVKAAAEVKIEGAVANVVVNEKATGAKVDVKDGAAIDNVVVAANDTEIKIANKDSVDKVKVVKNVTGTVVPEDVTKEEITKEDVDEILAHVHDYTVTRREATCTENGEIVYTCKTCTNVKTVKIKALGHDYKLKNTKEATCTEDGEKVYACTREGCGSTYSEPIKALGHNYKYEVITPATETEDGLGRYTCTRPGCKDSYDEVIKAGSKPTVTINGLSSLLRSILGDNFYFSLNDTYNVSEENTYVYENGKEISSTFEYFEITYIKNYTMYFDFTDDNQITGYMFYDVITYRTKDLIDYGFPVLGDLDLTGLNIFYTRESAQYMYVQGNDIYVKEIYTVEDSQNPRYNENNHIFGVTDFEMVINYLKNDDNVPEPIKALANILDYVFGKGMEEIDMNAVKAKLEGIIEAIKNKNNQGGQNVPQQPVSDVVINWIIENCFDVTTLNGDTVYTLNLQKLKAALDNYGAMTISQYIDATNGEGTSKEIKDLLNLVPTLDLNTLVGIVENAVADYNLTLNDIYAVVDFALTKIMGSEFSTAAFVKEYGEMKLADAIYLTSNDETMTKEAAQKLVDDQINAIIGMMDGMTVNDVLTTIMNMVKDAMPNPPANPDVPDTGDNTGNTEKGDVSNGDTSGDGSGSGEEQPELTFMDYVDMLIEQYGDQISLVVVKKVNGDVSYRLNALGYKVEFDLGKADNITFDLVVGTVEATMAHLNAILSETTAKVTVEVLDYTAKIDYDKANCSFSLVVTQKVETTDESTGTSEITENEFAKLTFTNGTDGFNVSLSVMQVEMIKALGTKENGSMTLCIPMGETMTTLTIEWTTVDGVTTVLIYDPTLLDSESEEEVRLGATQIVIDNSVAGAYKFELFMGTLDKNKTFTKDSLRGEIIKATVNTIVKEEKVIGLQGTVYVNDNMLNMMTGNGNDHSGNVDSSTSGTTTYHVSSMFKSKYNFKVMFNEKNDYDLTPVADIQAVLEKLSNINTTFVDYGSSLTEEYTIEYKKTADEEYYLVTVVEYNAYDTYANSTIYDGKLIVTTKTIRFPAENAYIKAVYMSAQQVCGDWYKLSLVTAGLETNKTTTVYVGTFERKYYEDNLDKYKYVPLEATVTETSNEYSYSSNSIDFIYNVKTKKAYDSIDDDNYFDIHNMTIKRTFDNGYKTCGAGVTIEYKCEDCGLEKVEKEYNCDYRLTNRYKLQTSCGTEYYEVRTCKNCGDQEIYVMSGELNTHSDKIHNFTADKEHEGVSECSDCGLTMTVTQTCQQEDGVCVAHEHTVFTLNGEKVLEYNLVYTDYTKIKYVSEQKYWNTDSEKGDNENYVSAEQAKQWLAEINKEMGINIDLSECEYISKSVNKCAAHDEVFSIDYWLQSENYFASLTYKYSQYVYKHLNVNTYSDGSVKGYNVEDVSKYLEEYDYDFSALNGVSAVLQIEDNSFDPYGRMTYTFYLADKDVVTVRYYSDEIIIGNKYNNVDYDREVVWYQHDICRLFTYDFVLDAAATKTTYRLVSQRTDVRHDEKYIAVGENCLEDGVKYTCAVCGYSGNDRVDYRHPGDKSDWGTDTTSIEGMRIEYSKHSCCNSYYTVTIDLTADVMLSQNVYILADLIRLNLNGYNLDLNGYDFVLATYDDNSGYYYKGDARIAVGDFNGRYNEETRETVYGTIVNGGNNGMFVAWTKDGDIELKNLNLDALSYELCDNTSRKEMQSHFEANGYTLNLNRMYFTSDNNY